LLLSCSRGRESTEFTFPQSVEAWRLKQVKNTAPADAPEQARRLGLKRAQAAEYEGPGQLKMELYEFISDASALEMEQTWKPAANTVAFHQGSYFTVIHWENADRAAVSGFVREMEKRVGR
jgi:hypothetical protein